MSAIPRLRMFAGPNGSGKSTIKAVIRPELLLAWFKAAVWDKMQSASAP